MRVRWPPEKLPISLPVSIDDISARLSAFSRFASNDATSNLSYFSSASAYSRRVRSLESCSRFAHCSSNCSRASLTPVTSSINSYTLWSSQSRMSCGNIPISSLVLMISPEVGVRSPLISLKRVVLPAPFEPTRPTLSPVLIENDTSWSISLLPVA